MDDIDAPSMWQVRLARWGPVYGLGALLNVPIVLGFGYIVLENVPGLSLEQEVLLVLLLPPALVTALVTRFFGLSGWLGLLIAYVVIAVVGAGVALFWLLMHL